MRTRGTTALFAVCMAWAAVAAAQIQQDTPAPGSPDPHGTMPDKRGPSDPRIPPPDGPMETLSDRLGRTGGVIRPPNDIAPGMNIPAPVPNPRTPVIPPPGSPGNPSPVIPK
jgi:hypothetical protein